jgi:secreted Zn-dependent insulinase-like peptidase
MSATKVIQVKAAIYEMGLLFNQNPNDEKITAYANALVNYEPHQIIFAFKQVINSGSAFFPSLAEILKHLKPIQENLEDRAPSIASEIIQLLKWYGPHDEENMLNQATQEARRVLLRLGYTGDIRNSENTDVVRAQLERLARSVLSNMKAEIKNEQLQKIGIKTEGMKKLDFSIGGLP